MSGTNCHLCLRSGTALAVGKLHAKDLAPAVPVDAHRDEDRLGDDYPRLAHPLVAGIEDEVGEVLRQAPLGEGLEARVQGLVDVADGGGREGVTAQLFGDRLDPRIKSEDRLLRVETPCTLGSSPRAGSHLRQRPHQRLLGALVALE